MGGIEDAMAVQLSDWNGLYEFACARCQSWKGGCGCKRNVLIVAEGANTVMCTLFEEETDLDVLRDRQRKRCGW
jgi:hypothetical protein